MPKHKVFNLRVQDPKNIFLVSDFHFDHTNIIKYCSRPWAYDKAGTERMNNLMLERYRETVQANSQVIFLGDMAFGRDSRPPRYWLKLLPEITIYLKGSHDHGIRPTEDNNVYDSCELKIGSTLLYLIHEPELASPSSTDQWIIHGHHHNYVPHLQPEKKRVNVSVEVIGYRPISLDQILKEINSVE